MWRRRDSSADAMLMDVSIDDLALRVCEIEYACASIHLCLNAASLELAMVWTCVDEFACTLGYANGYNRAWLLGSVRNGLK